MARFVLTNLAVIGVGTIAAFWFRLNARATVEYVGECIGDLHRRRGTVRAQDHRGNAAVIEAHVPLKEMFGYIGTLRALSSGRAQYAMQFAHYDVAPMSVVSEAAGA